MVLCRSKEAELDEETATKRPRKRTASESLPKKPKLMKPTTGRYLVLLYCIAVSGSEILMIKCVKI